METTIMGFIGAALKIPSFIPSQPKVRKSSLFDSSFLAFPCLQGDWKHVRANFVSNQNPETQPTCHSFFSIIMCGIQ